MISKLSNSSLLSKGYYKSMLAGNAPYDPSAFQLLETALIASNVATVTFDTSTYAALGYKHLQLRITSRGNDTSTYGGKYSGHYYRFNSDSGSNYSAHFLKGDGSSAISVGFANATSLGTGAYSFEMVGNGAPTGVYGFTVMDIFDAFSTSKSKTTRSFNGYMQTSSDAQIGVISGNWRNNAAISSITIGTTISTNFIAGSRFSLYGIKG